jgi:uracil-DNA glycosylase
MTRDQIAERFGPSWVDFMAPFVQSEDFTKILVKLREEKARVVPLNQSILPLDQTQIFRCFKETPLDKLRVVLIGQDPYPSKAYANGLAFAVNEDVDPPASLKQIIRAIEIDMSNGLNLNIATQFDKTLKLWTQQGMMLMNSALTVVESDPKSHAAIWEPFTKYVLSKLDAISKRLIFVAWGADAQEFTKSIQIFNHFVLTHEHPARAARENREWLCKHFSLINAIITKNGLGDPIVWFTPF